MHKLEQQLKNIILKNVDFQIDGKSIKRGKIKVYNTKQFFIRFKLEQDDDKQVEYDLPYPFKVIQKPDGYIFDYTLSAFCPRTEELYWKMLLMNKSDASRLHNNYLYLVTHTISLSG
jgi:hypothetical protein